MSDFMDIGKQKLIGVEISVDRDGLYAAVSTVAEVPKFGFSSFVNRKMKGVFLPNPNAILKAGKRKMAGKDLPELFR